MVKRMLGRHGAPVPAPALEVRLEAARGRALVEESRELVVVVDDEDRVVVASRRARGVFGGLEEGRTVPPALLRDDARVSVAYELDGRRERLLYVREKGDLAAYEELRAGFTAAVSQELRTP